LIGLKSFLLIKSTEWEAKWR